MTDSSARCSDDSPDLSTLPKRMRFAALVLDEARKEFHSRTENMSSNWIALAWNKGDLCTFASKWERSDEHRTIVSESVLPRCSCGFSPSGGRVEELWRSMFAHLDGDDA